MPLFGSISPSTTLGFKNFLINGNFDIWQRGTSTSTMTAYLADRWQGQTGTTGTQSQQSFTPGQTDVPGEPTYFLRWNKTGTGDYSLVAQKIEDVRTLAGKTVTVSFYAKADSSLGLQVQLNQNFGSGGSSVVTLVAQGTTLTTSWARYSFTFSMPSITGKTIGTSSFSQLSFLPANQSLASTHTFDLAQVQLEEGSLATNFERRPYGLELHLCHRYCYVFGGEGNARFALSGNISGTSSFPTMYLPVELRGSPSITVNSASSFFTEQLSGGQQTCTGISLNAYTDHAVTLQATVSSNFSGPVNLLGNSSARLTISSEL